MNALYYLFRTPLILLIMVLITLIGLVFIPSSIFNKKRWALKIILLEIIVFGIAIFFHLQPREYPKTYLNQEQVNFDTLKKSL